MPEVAAAPMSVSTPRRSRRRRWLLLLAGGMLLLGALGTVIASRQAAHQRLVEDRARARIKELDGRCVEVSRTRELPGLAPDSFVYRSIGRFLVRRRIAEIDVERQSAGDDDLQLFVDASTDIEKLDVSSTGVTDRSFTQLGRLWRLSVLEARNTDVTDEGIRPLAGLSNLTLIELDGTRITDAALADLAKCPRLSRISVPRTRVTDAGIAHLHGKNLMVLNVAETAVTDAGVAAFRAANPGCIVVH